MDLQSRKQGVQGDFNIEALLPVTQQNSARHVIKREESS